MHHEHHGDCCAPQEPHLQEHHNHVALPLGQLCCAGACSHMEHQFIVDQLQTMHQAVIEAQPDTKNKNKKSKRKRIGNFSLVASSSLMAEGSRGLAVNLSQ